MYPWCLQKHVALFADPLTTQVPIVRVVQRQQLWVPGSHASCEDATEAVVHANRAMSGRTSFFILDIPLVLGPLQKMRPSVHGAASSDLGLERDARKILALRHSLQCRR
jgi:hypothetical protein